MIVWKGSGNGSDDESFTSLSDEQFAKHPIGNRILVTCRDECLDRQHLRHELYFLYPDDRPASVHEAIASAESRGMIQYDHGRMVTTPKGDKYV